MVATTRKLHHFHGGVHMPGHKEASTRLPVADAGIPGRIVIALQQHIGAPAEPVVKVGDRVLKGQIVGRASGYVSAPVHASSSGTVTAIEPLPVPHPSGLSIPCVVIETDGEDRWAELQPLEGYPEAEPDLLRARIRDAGIVGLGGAAFPTAVKLTPPADAAIDTLIINGAECEPYISCDDMLMRERPEEVIQGVVIMRRILGVQACIVGLEDNKPEAFQALQAAAAGTGIEVVQVPTIYPTGGEKQLIKVLTGKEVPSRGIPAQIGIVCQNVATAAAVYRAVRFGEPLISRIVTVTGGAVREPRNLDTLIGTPMEHLLDRCDPHLTPEDKLIMGGPMMGIPLRDGSLPTVKATNCLLAATPGDQPNQGQTMPCIRCGECTRVCPVNLLPQQMYWHARAREFDKIQDYNLFDCIECGCCSYVCPSHIPLVQYYRFAKTEIWDQEREKKKADLARRRHEFKQMRIEREKREKAERHKAAAARAAAKTNAGKADAGKAAGGANTATAAGKQAAIQAAMERTRAKREAAAQAGAEPKQTANDADA